MYQSVPKKRLSLSVLTGLLLGLSACHNPEVVIPDRLADEQKVDVGGYPITARLTGQGPATIILFSGADTPLAYWEKVQNPASATARVLAYDRGGYRDSHLPDGPRDGITIVRELRRLLDKKALRPPYILVAHSLGGAYAQLFAALHPNEVKGVVMADCTPDKDLELTARLPKLLYPKFNYAGTKAEFKAMAETVDQIRFTGGLPDLPLVVITNTKLASNENTKSKEEDYRQQARWLEGKTRAAQWKTDKGHLVPVYDPAIILKAIQQVNQ